MWKRARFVNANIVVFPDWKSTSARRNSSEFQFLCKLHFPLICLSHSPPQKFVYYNGAWFAYCSRSWRLH